jgi:hypothetical protein
MHFARSSSIRFQTIRGDESAGESAYKTSQHELRADQKQPSNLSFAKLLHAVRCAYRCKVSGIRRKSLPAETSTVRNCACCRAEAEWRASEIFNPCETFGIFGNHIPGLLYGVDIGSPAFLRLGDRPPDRSAHKSTGFTAPVQLITEYMRNRMRSKI